ncbi:MAG: PQQ-binding-like beta-propeller repeat protein [Candidatus Aenigmatarchaeota archaeon]
MLTIIFVIASDMTPGVQIQPNSTVITLLTYDRNMSFDQQDFTYESILVDDDKVTFQNSSDYSPIKFNSTVSFSNLNVTILSWELVSQNITVYVSGSDSPNFIYFNITRNDTASCVNNQTVPGDGYFNLYCPRLLYSLDSTNSSSVGSSTLHSLNWTSDLELSGYIFSFDNCAGTLSNDSWTPFSGTWSNVTKTISLTPGCTVRWCVYANDSADNWNSNSCDSPFSYVTSDTEPPYYANNVSSLIETYTPVGYSNFSVEWNDNSASLSGAYIENNFTGVLENDTMSGSYPSYYYNSTPLKAGAYMYRFVADDSSWNTNATPVVEFSIAKVAGEINLYLNGSRSNFDMGASGGINISAALVYQQSSNIDIWTNYSDGAWKIWKSCIDCSSLQNVTNLTTNGIWNFTANISSNENYTDGSDGWIAFFVEIIDVTPPRWSKNLTNVTSGTEYLKDRAYRFNATWTDQESSVDTVIIEHNFTGGSSTHNDTITWNDEGSAYYFDAVDLASGTYAWKMYASNIKDLWNVTNGGNYWTYAVAKNSTNIVDVYFNGTKNSNRTYTYPEAVNSTADSSSGAVSLYRNGIESAAGESPQSENVLLGNGTYAYKVNSSGNQNYSENSTGLTFYVLVNKGTPDIATFIDGDQSNKTVDYPASANIEGSSTSFNPPTFNLYIGSINIGSGSFVSESVTMGNGTYQIVYNTSGNSNWTSGSDSTLYLLVNKGTPALTLSNNMSWSSTYPEAINTTGSECPPELACNLYRNDTGQIGSNEDNVILGYGAYNYTYNTSGNENWTSFQDSNILTVAKGVLHLDITSPQSGTYPYQTNMIGTENNIGDNDVTYQLWRNITMVDSTNPYQEQTYLPAYMWQYIFNATGGANWTANATGITTTATISQNSSTLNYMNLTINGTESNKTYTYPNASNATGWYSSSFSGQNIAFNLYRNSTPIGSSNPVSDTSLFGVNYYQYVYNTSGNENYSAASRSITVNESKGTVLLALTNNTSWSVTYPKATSIGCSVASYGNEVICSLYRNGTFVSSPEASLFGIGAYNYSTNSSGTENYSANVSGTFNILSVQTNSSSSVNLYLNGSRSNSNVSVGYSLNTTAVLLIPTSGSIDIWTNYSDGVWKIWKSCTDCSSLQNVTVLSSIGIWNFTANFSGSNYVPVSEGWVVNVSDTSAPTWSQLGANATVIGIGKTIKLFANWSDNYNLDYSWLSTNETGAWRNYTGGTYGSPYNINQSPAETWSNFSWNNASIPAGSVVGWMIYANDSTENVNVTQLQYFIMNLSELWNYTTGGSLFSSPAIADVNGDSFIDVVIGSDDRNVYAINGSSGLKLWNYTTDDAVGSSPSLADMVGGTGLEVVVGSFDYNLYLLNGTNGSKIWNYTTGGVVWSSPAIGDLNKDTYPEIAIGSDNGTLYSINRTGNMTWMFSAQNSIWSSPAVADINNDNNLEVVFTSYDGSVYAINGTNGSKIWNYTVSDMVESSPAIADINNDGIKEVVFGSYDGRIYALKGTDGTQVWNFSTREWVISSPAIANISNSLKVIIGSDDGTIYAINGDGSTFWNYTIPTGGRIESSPSIQDMNNDGVVDIIAASSDGNIYAINGLNGNLIFKYNVRGYLYSTPSIEDINGDGRMDIIIGSISNSVHSLDPPISWSMFGGNERRTRIFDNTPPEALTYGSVFFNSSANIYSFWRDSYSNLGSGFIEENSNQAWKSHDVKVFSTKSWVNYTISYSENQNKGQNNCMIQCKLVCGPLDSKNLCLSKTKDCTSKCKSTGATIGYRIHAMDAFGNENVINGTITCG